MNSMEEFDPTGCANCAGPLRADYIVIDQGQVSWNLCGWECAHEFTRNPGTKRAADTATGLLHRAWSSGSIRWYVYRTGSGGLVRKVTEHLIPFKSLAGAVAAAKAEAGPKAKQIPTGSP